MRPSALFWCLVLALVSLAGAGEPSPLGRAEGKEARRPAGAEEPRRPARAERAAVAEQPPPPREPKLPSPREYREQFLQSPARRAVDRALGWLAERQLPDGSWITPGYGKNTGVVSLAVMAFLARGHQPGRGEHGGAIERAIAWLLSRERQGMLVQDVSHGPMYSHGITTLLLSEVIGSIDPRRPGLADIDRVHRRAVDVILRAQNVPKSRWDFGGWRYRPGSVDSDLSVTGWQLLALRAARQAGLSVPKRNIDQAVRYVIECAHPSGGFGYRPAEPPTIALTGTGVLSLEICGEHDSRQARRGGDWLLKHPLPWAGPYFYYSAYYGAQAMYQLGGTHWSGWKGPTEALLLAHQEADGSWPFPSGSDLEARAGRAYSTAMAALALAVEFRYLPIYQR